MYFRITGDLYLPLKYSRFWLRKYLWVDLVYDYRNETFVKYVLLETCKLNKFGAIS